MTYVVGLDLSLTSTGVALVNSDGRAVVQRVRSKGKRADSLVQRRDRLRRLSEEVQGLAGAPTLAVVERQIGGQMSGSTHDRSALWWGVVGALIDRRVPVLDVVPQHLKMFVTGKGNAGKDEVLAAAIRRYGEVVELSGNDEADALGLADMGASLCGFPLCELPQQNLRALAGLEVPAAQE